MGGIYEVIHDIHTGFHKGWFRHSKVDKEQFTERQRDGRISLLLYFQKKGK
jgi:hypothetical protein